MKKILIGAVIGVVALIIIVGVAGIVMLAGIGKTADVIDKEITKQEIKNVDDKNKLKITNIKKSGDTISGEVKNTLDYKIGYLEVSIKYLDKNKKKLSDDMEITTDLEKGETWKFDFYLFQEDFDSYSIKINELSNY